jgi:hypothetical protein
MALTSRLLILPLLLAATSCQEWPFATQTNAPAPVQVSATNPALFGSTGGPADSVVLLIRFRLISVEVPVGSVSGSEELWSYLDEEKIGLERTSVLGRNGLRIGLAKGNHLPDILKILTRLTGRTLQETNGVSLPGDPYPVILKQAQPIQTIFVSNQDRTLTGCDYPDGDNAMALSCTLNQDDPRMIMITGVPQIRTTQRHWRLSAESGQMSMVYQPLVYSFNPLMFSIGLSSKDVLVIGPGSLSRRPYSLGRHFLVRQREGVELETVLVLIPEVVAEPIKKK